MNESLILQLVQLFSLIVTKARVPVETAEQAFVQFMERHDLSEEQCAPYLKKFSEQTRRLTSDTQHLINIDVDASVIFIEKLVEVAGKANHEFEQQQKMWLVLQFLEFLGELNVTDPTAVDFVRHFSRMLRISEAEFEDCSRFILGTETELPHNHHLLLVANHNPYHDETSLQSGSTPRFLLNEKIKGKVYVLYVESNNMMLIRYFGERALFFNGRNLRVGQVYIFGVGGVIRNPHIDPIYYNKVLGQFTQSDEISPISYVANNVSYKFAGSKNGIHPFSFHAVSGELIAIMGGSGVGKSTLLNLLSGQLSLRTGQICINGHDIHAEKTRVESVIGYVPQDDLLIEELTVYENLCYNARLCFKDYTLPQIDEVVNKTIEQFDLVEAAHFKVGSPLNKFISGGQRKRLNMAMELIRHPAILFVDEPTSGLSSIDSEKVLHLLKRQSMQGKIVIINIHQPSSDLFKLFTRLLLLDHGGHVIFQGNPMDAIVYFKGVSHSLHPEESECITCGNVNTELILRIVEARTVNEYGKLTRKRKHSAGDWYRRYMQKINPKIWNAIPPKTPLPQSNFKIPNHGKQLLIFFLRNLKAKLANRQYLFITLVEAPLLALILGYFTKFVAGTAADPNQYVFAENSNIPSYLFICVIAVLFFGLSASAQEIIKDRKVLQRERLLHLSRNSYLLSKVLFLLAVSAVQSLLFVLVGNFILEIQGLTLPYFAILFSTSVCANLIGLNLSSALNSEVAIYICIPLILVPQLLFSGVVVQYEKLNHRGGSGDKVPIVAECTPARWAYEALAVTQFKNNRYERIFFDYEQTQSHLSYLANLWVPQMSIALATAQRDLAQGTSDPYTHDGWLLLHNELPQWQSLCADFGVALPIMDSLSSNKFSPTAAKLLQQNLDSLRTHLQAANRQISRQKDEHSKLIISELGGTKTLQTLKKQYYNHALADLVLNRNDVDKILEVNHHLVQVKDPIFKTPTSQWGRAHFYAPCKVVAGKRVGTLYFNMAILWAMSLLLYLLLYLDWIRLALQRIEKIHLRKTAIRFARAIPT